jgi:hypothetical protein
VLQNKVRRSGRIAAFDNYVIVLDGQKNEIVYRHAVSCLFPASAAEQARPAPQRIEQQRPAPRAEKRSAPAAAAQRTHKPSSKAPASPEPGINTGMKEGLLRWMQEQKSAK